MAKLLHERLREYSEDRYVYSCNTKDIASVIGVDTDCRDQCSECRKRVYEAFADEIERYYIPRPRFEDGEPVHFGDIAIGESVHWKVENGSDIADEEIEEIEGVVEGYEFDSDGSTWLCIADDECLCHRVCPPEGDYYFKRPTPKVLDADGVEIKVGDTVWNKGAAEYIVEEIKDEDHIYLRRPYEYEALVKMTARCLTHKEPDSLERLIDDMVQIVDQKDVDGIDLEAWISRLSAIIERISS